MNLDLPPISIGKDYLGGHVFAKAPSGSGFQFSLFGMFGMTAALEEGLELNILGLSFGIDPKDPALKLPLVGRIGADRRAAPGGSRPARRAARDRQRQSRLAIFPMPPPDIEARGFQGPGKSFAIKDGPPRPRP